LGGHAETKHRGGDDDGEPVMAIQRGASRTRRGGGGVEWVCLVDGGPTCKILRGRECWLPKLVYSVYGPARVASDFTRLQIV
jgi:hypothetical protein